MVHARLEQGLIALAAFMFALGLSYAVRTLGALGDDFNAAAQRRYDEQAAARHVAACERLGLPPSSPDHARCLDVLHDLRSWHERAAQQLLAGPL